MRAFDFDPETDVPNLSGKVIIITGGTGGLGATTAIQLARHAPAKLYITGRNAVAAESVIERARQSINSCKRTEADAKKTDIEFLHCDLADLSSVSAAAETILAAETRLDVLIANAAICAVPPGRTKDGYEIQFGTNYLGHALLIQKLLPLMSRTARLEGDARIVVLTSFAYHAATGISFDTLKARPGCDWTSIGRWMRYAESKLACLLFARELARRYPEISSVSVHPGVSSTSLVDQMTLLDRVGTKLLGLMEGGVLEPEQGALNQIWAATVAGEKLQNGATYSPIGIQPKWVGRPAQDARLAEQLWAWTEEEMVRWMMRE